MSDKPDIEIGFHPNPECVFNQPVSTPDEFAGLCNRAPDTCGSFADVEPGREIRREEVMRLSARILAEPIGYYDAARKEFVTHPERIAVI